jgi:hypothetical protein
MRSVCLLLAQAVRDQAEGTVDLLGAGIGRLTAAAFPSSPIPLVVFAIIEIEAPECGYPHQLRLECRGPDGQLVAALPPQEITPRPMPEAPYRSIFHGVSLRIDDFSVRAPGDYAFYLLVDQLVLDKIPLYVSPATS